LQLEKFYFQIEACDFRIQAYITRQLLATVEDAQCNPCASNAAFQLALCYSFGFGVRADSNKCQYWLKRSGKEDADLENVINLIRTIEPPIEELGQLIDLGYQSELAETYVDQGIVAEAVAEYRAMILSREQAFGDTHFSPLRMRSLLGDILQRNNQPEEAAKIRAREIEIALQIPDSQQGSILLLKAKLARTLEDLGDFEKSEALRFEVLEGYSKLPKGTVGRVVALYDLSSSSLEQGKYITAVERAQVAVDESVKVLGQDHSNTLNARGILATAYFKLGEAQKAIDQNEEVLRFRKQGLGMDHRDTIETLNRLALQYHSLGLWEKAKNAFGEVWKARKKSDGEASRSALLAGNNYAGTILKLGEIEEARCIQEEVLGEMMRLLGAEDQRTFSVMAGLAITYEHLRLWNEAEDLEKKVLAYRRQNLGLNHTETLQAMRSLADTLFNQKKWAEAAELGLEEIKIRQLKNEKPDNAMLEAIIGCTRSLVHLERWTEAGPLLDLEIKIRIELGSKNDDVERFEAIVLVAIWHMKTHEWLKARQQIAALFEESLQLKNGRKSMADKIDVLAACCQLNGWLEEAEQLFALQFLVREACCPEDKQGLEELAKKIIRVMEIQGKSDMSLEFNPKDIIARAKSE
jgi:tetratricopeptide (TPR) repeat protein